MYRLLIVDDEAIITDGLYEVFQNLTYLDLDVYKAYSGKEALDILNRTRIDIVLSDICMPEMDGLQLLKEIDGRWPECRVIFLSGHTEFEYVYNAIQYDKVNYLLKTEGYHKVIAAVENAVEDIEKSLKWEALIKKAEDQIGTTQELLKDDFLKNILKGRYFPQEINQQQFDELGLQLDSNHSVIMLIGRIDNLPKGLPYSIKSRRIYTVRLIAEQFFSLHMQFEHFIDENFNLIWFIQPAKDRKEDIKSLWNECLVFIRGNTELIQKGCMESIEASVSFALDDSPAKWSELPDRYATLKMVLNYRFGHDSGMLLTDRRVMEKELKKIQVQSSEKLSINRMQYELLAETLEYGKKDDFFEYFEELTENLKKVRSLHNLVALEQYHSIALIFLSYINRWNLIEQVAFKTGIYKLMKVDEHETWQDAVDYLQLVGTILFDIQDLDQQKRTQDVIGVIQKHINDRIHLQDEVTLVYLADLVHLNPSYLSRLFKQVVGMNLSEYISEVRIKKAKQFLENPDIKINVVAENLGYEIPTNFTRFFRKAMNMTPQEYRDFILGNRS